MTFELTANGWQSQKGKRMTELVREKKEEKTKVPIHMAVFYPLKFTEIQ